jgi:two-component system CheB/CheR fusion protein
MSSSFVSQVLASRRSPDEALAPEGWPHGQDSRLLSVIVELVRHHTQVDVSHYKESTFRRQLDRRLTELGVPDLAAYVAWLEQEPQELQRLQQSLLISVTRFFRDADVFTRLRQVMAELVASKADGDTLRLWVPGCATGEEAYSLAMLAADALGERLGRVQVRLFATDIDHGAIQQARLGHYPQAALADIPPELAERHTVPDGHGGFRLHKVIRDMCVFAPHDLLSQPPFVNLDLVSCRNVLIYFQADIQSEILAKFHHALRPQGWLMLGQSESAAGAPGLYASADKSHKLFRRQGVASPCLHDMATLTRPFMHTHAPAAPAMASATGLAARFHEALAQHHAPPAVLVDPAGQVLHLSGRLEPYLTVEGGRADFSLVGLCRAALRDTVRTLLHLASASADPMVQVASVEPAGPHARVRIVARRLPNHLSTTPSSTPSDAAAPLVVTFEPLPAAPQPFAEAPHAEAPVQAVAQLQDELDTTREHLQVLVQQLEHARHERQALHEELQVSSEELQSSNEELQASNEELTTLNEQLQAKSEELTGLNDVLLSIERSVQMAMVVLDDQLRVLRFNPLAVRIFGLLDHDIGRPLHRVPSSLPLPQLPAQVASVLASGEALVTRVDEGQRHYMLQISPLRDARERLSGVILSFTDVADLRSAELERSRLAAIVTSSQDAIIGKTLQGIITSWNPGAVRLFGYTAEEAIGQPMLMVFPPELQHDEARLLSAIGRGEVVHSFDTVRLHKSGQRVAVSVTLSPIRDGSGRIVGASKVARDISERRQLEAERQRAHERLEEQVVARTAELADKEQQLENILEGMPGLVGYWGTDLRLKYANHQHRTRLIYHGDNGGVGLDMVTMLGAERAAFVQPYVEQVLSGQPAEFEVGPVQAPGREGPSWFQVQYVPDTRHGEVVGFIAMGFDITKVKQAEAEAAAASQAKSDFLSNMSHEIRTPLNAVLGLAQVGQRQHAGQPGGGTFDHILNAGRHLLGVINDVLDFSKIEAGKLELQVSRVDLIDLVDSVVHLVADQARSKGLTLAVSRDPALPEAVAADPVRLSQLLINLLNNAVKFTDQGRVDLVLRQVPEGLSVVVNDTGPGMGADVMARLFHPFERGDSSTTRRVGGTGLGLSICKRLADLMGGRITVDSQLGQGTRFEVVLPLQPLHTHLLQPVASFAPPAGGAHQGPRLAGLHLLVAEDHPVNQMVLSQLLEAEGAHLDIVAHGGLAVEQVRTKGLQHYQLVLCDIEMPVMDGYEATRQIKALAPGLPVIGLTAHAFEDARKQGQAAGMDGYITKPYMLDALVQEVLRLSGGTPEQPVRAIQEPVASVLDLAALHAHYGLLPDFLPKLLDAVRRTCERQPQALRAAVQAGDFNQLRHLAHGVAGMAANLLLRELTDQARLLEQLAGQDPQAAEALALQLAEGLERLTVHLAGDLA